jgi:branched-subunit amino acid transport protein
MTDTSVWLAVLGVTLATIIARSTMLLIGQRLELAPWLDVALRYAPGCALAAIIAPELLVTDGVPQLSFDNFKLWGAAAGILAFSLSRSIVATIGLGMAGFWIARAWLS